MFFSWTYNIVLLLLALLALPKVAYGVVVRGKYRSSLVQRWGGGFPVIEKGSKPLVWVHAVSVGEVRAVAGLVRRIKAGEGNPIVVVSSVTETGHAEAKRSVPEADEHLFLPLDFSWVVRRVLRRAQPDVVIVCETDLWYQFLKGAKDGGAKVVLVNGKVSERSARRLRWVPWFARRLYGLVDLLCVQNDIYRDRFCAVGVPEDKIVVTGNLKFDGEYPALGADELAERRCRYGIGETDPVLVVGSTHDPEERQILSQLRAVWSSVPNLKVLLVPRHPERFGAVAQILKRAQIPFVRHSDADSATGDERVVLVDAMGVLRDCYQLADVAVVAGSYVSRVGGHNILEPCWYGVPVIYGPEMHSQPDLLQLVEQYRAGESVAMDQLGGALISLFGDSDRRQSLGAAGKTLTSSIHGATDRTWHAAGF